MAERNPYLILGVDFGAASDEARRKFAASARKARRGGGPWTIEDLNWALHQIESSQSDADESVSVFRVPANPRAFDPVGSGLFRPEPEVAGRRSDPSTNADHEQLAAAAAREIAAVVWNEIAERPDITGLLYEIEGGTA